MKDVQNRPPSVRFSDDVLISESKVKADNPVQKSVSGNGGGGGGSAGRKKRKPQGGSVYMRSDGRVKHVFR